MIGQIPFYGVPFLISFAIASILCFVIIRFISLFPVTDHRRSKRHIHKKNTSRFGGVAIILALVVTLFLNQYLFFDRIVWAIIVGGGLFIIFGIVDDIKPLSWQSQLFSQVSIVLLIFIMGVRVDYITNPFGEVIWLVRDNMPLLSLFFMMVWMLVIINTINWCDGMDGLAGGVIFIATITLAIISLQPQVMQPPMALISVILAGSVGGFLIFNLPPAKIFAGSSGAFFMGYVIALIAIAAGAKIGTTLLVFAVPLVDAFWVVWHRIRDGESIFRSNKNHLHHRLLDQGWSVQRILFLYYVITIACAFIAIATHATTKVVALVLLSVLIFVFFLTLSYNKKSDVAL